MRSISSSTCAKAGSSSDEPKWRNPTAERAKSTDKTRHFASLAQEDSHQCPLWLIQVAEVALALPASAGRESPGASSPHAVVFASAFDLVFAHCRRLYLDIHNLAADSVPAEVPVVGTPSVNTTNAPLVHAPTVNENCGAGAARLFGSRKLTCMAPATN
jgi:hypothetical protein